MRGRCPTDATCSRVGQIEAPLNTFDADIHPIKPIRNIGVLVFKIADALLYLTNIVAHINSPTDMAQMLKNDVVRFSHGARIS